MEMSDSRYMMQLLVELGSRDERLKETAEQIGHVWRADRFATRHAGKLFERTRIVEFLRKLARGEYLRKQAKTKLQGPAYLVLERLAEDLREGRHHE